MSMSSERPQDDPLYQAGFLDGRASRQTEIDRLEELADRYYAAAFNDTRRPIVAALVTAVDVEQHRQQLQTPPAITPAQALESWGIRTETTPPPQSVQQRRPSMSVRTISGNLAADPQTVQAGNIRIVKLRVIENTGEYRQGKWHSHDTATTHFVEAKFELGDNVAASLHKGDAVIVTGRERTVSWGDEGNRQYGRTLDADSIGADLSRATAVITRNPRDDAAR
jgi:hypothetical protein